MTGIEVIDQIKRLPKEERQKVIDFARHEDARRLSPDELGDIARRMIETPDEPEARRLREEFMRGFYGNELPHA
jgi:hypothetical protein